MATKNETAETLKTPVDEWEIMKTVHLPKAHKGDDPSLFVAVNGRSYLVPKGVSVEVPWPIAERIEIMNECNDELIDYRETIPNEAAPQK